MAKKPAPPAGNPLHPSAAVLCKLGSIMVHAEELMDPVKGHHFDRIELQERLDDPEVQEWRSQMNALGMLPVRR